MCDTFRLSRVNMWHLTVNKANMWHLKVDKGKHVAP